MLLVILLSIAIGIVTGYALKHVIDRQKIETLNTQLEALKEMTKILGEYALQTVDDYNQLAGYQAKQFDPFNLREILERKDNQ